MPATFLSLPYLVRKRIYFFAHLTRECPVVIVPASQLVNRPDHSTFPANVPGWGWRCQFQLRKNLDGGPIPKETRECRCPEFPKQLLLLNKALHTEVQAILYGENKFVLRAHQAEGLRVFGMLSSDAIDKLRYLLVRLNSWPCYRGHSRANLDRGVCLGCRAPVSSSDREISAGDIHTGSILTQWSAVCSRLASSAVPGCLRLEFICDVTDEVTAKQILQPLYMLPQLQECTIRLGRHHDQSLRSLARLAATRLTNSDPADSPGENASSCFRFGFLPPEIRHKILRYTDLGPDGSYRPQWKDIVVKRGRFDQTLGLTTSLIRRDCCLNCSFTKLDCSCPLQYASYSPHCQCRNLPLDLFLVSQQTYQDASEIFYSTNVFIFTGPFLDTLGMLQSLKPSSLIHFRRITFDLQTTQSLQWRELESTWLPLLSFISRHCDISQLLITIKCGDDYEECIEPTYNEPMMRNLYNGYKTLVQGLKSTLPGLLDFHLTLGAFLQLEPTWEKYIMGPNYDSREGNRYSKAAHSVDIWPHLSPDVTSALHWHEEF